MKVRTDGLTVVYEEVRALDAESVTAEPGELFFLLGPSGCGKTTLLRAVAGFVAPTEGHVYFGGRPMRDVPPQKRNIGMVFQSYALWPHMTVEQNVGYGLEVRKVPGEERRKRVGEALNAGGMGGFGERKPGELSGGEQQRVALARALVVRPEVVLLDEPLSNLDARLRLEMRQEIRDIQRRTGITMIYVTHDQTEALSMADRLAVMREGRIAQVGSPSLVYDAPADEFVANFVGEANIVEAESLEGKRFKTPLGEFAIGAEPGRGGPCKLFFRPEALEPGEGENSFRGRVRSASFLGAFESVEIEAGGMRLKALFVGRSGLETGSEAAFHVSPAKVRVLRA